MLRELEWVYEMIRMNIAQRSEEGADMAALRAEYEAFWRLIRASRNWTHCMSGYWPPHSLSLETLNPQTGHRSPLAGPRIRLNSRSYSQPASSRIVF